MNDVRALHPPSLGTLSWHPAGDHPDILAPVVAEALNNLALTVWAAEIDPALADTAAFCETYQVPMAASANCVVVTGRRGEEERTAACLVLATDRADVNRTVRKRLDVRKISFASMDDAVSRSQMAYGGITAIGLPADWPILVDRAVLEQPWIVIGSGIRGSKLAITGADAAMLPGAEVLELTR